MMTPNNDVTETIKRLQQHPVTCLDGQNITGDAADLIIQLVDLRARFDQEIRFYTEGKSALYESEIKKLQNALLAVWTLRPPGACTNAIYEANRHAIDSVTNKESKS